MKELVDQDPGGIFRPINKDAGGVAGIGISPVNIERRDWFVLFRKLAESWMGTQKDRVGLAIGSLIQL